MKKNNLYFYINPIFVAWIFLSVGVNVCSQSNDDAKLLFKTYQDRLFQIRTIDKASGSKSSIGSGFTIAEDGRLITNYHVVSNFILHPEKYLLQAVDFESNEWPIEVIQVDVINDLALVKLPDDRQYSFLQFAESKPEQGDVIYSLGNPRDLGMTVVPGTYNGETAHSYYHRILFSGSVNPGMSGGPVLDSMGHVLGVNVATSGNQISFLVPLQRVIQLTQSPIVEGLPHQQQAQAQLLANQKEIMEKLFNGRWEQEALGQSKVIGELTDFIRCWGGTEDHKDNKFIEVSRRCRNQEYIYVAPDFYTGIIEMEFFWYEAKTLSSSQFYRMLNDSFASMSAGNVASKDHVTEFHCETQFVTQKSKMKIVYCVRSYKQFDDLYDVLFLSATIDNPRNSLVSHYSLSGIQKSLASQFLTQFLEHNQ